ncbi:MAG: hypothetical protein JWN90_77, partial [Parcubacteria group bacterium]|nr:hypothetical protein [Parcubacteria group bacterium]
MNYSNLFDTPEIEGKVITVSSLGLLHAPTGQIVVCDPLASSLSDVKSLEKTIPSGDYEVKVSSVDMPGLRHAAAKLVITKNKPVRWESAYADESQGLVVDAGLGCFCDAETATRYKAFEDDFLTKNPGANMYDDYFAAKFKENAIDKSDPMDIGNWLNFKLPNSEEHNIVMFNSGYGDG